MRVGNEAERMELASFTKQMIEWMSNEIWSIGHRMVYRKEENVDGLHQCSVAGEREGRGG